jgi:flagellar biosynthesis/type III secretory pathway chaperone
MSASQQASTETPPISALQRPSVPESAYDAFFNVVDRLETLLDDEMHALKQSGGIDFSELTRRKRQGCLELNRLMRSFEGTIPSQDIINRLAAFRVKLDENGTALRLHLQAAQEITATIVRVMQEMDSDGTYSRAAVYGGLELA